MARLALLLGALLLATPARADDRWPRTRYALEVTLSEGLERLDGRLEAEVVNDAGATVDALTVWLPAASYARPLQGQTATNLDLLVPTGDGLGGAAIDEARLEGEPVVLAPIEVADVPAGVALLVRLPAPLPPQARARLSLGFHVDVPERTGALGRHEASFTAMGTFHPFVVAGDARERGLDARRPRAADFVLDARLPAGRRGVAGGREIGPADGPQHFPAREWLELLVRPPGERALHVRGGLLLPLQPAPVRGRSRDEGGLPDVAAAPAEWRGDDLAALVERLDAWADLQRELPDPGPLPVAVVPLRSEAALASPGIVLVSDRAFALAPFAAARTFHERAIARAILAARVLPVVRARERPEDVIVVADAIGARYAERFLDEQAGEGGLSDWLAALDFIPEVDDFLRSPRAAFPHVYFRPTAEPLIVRDEPSSFAHPGPRGRLLLERTIDLAGAPTVDRAIARYLGDRRCPPPAPGPGPSRCGLRATLEGELGRDLGAHFAAFTARFPQEELRVRLLAPGDATTPARIAIERLGDAPPAVIEVALLETGGRRYVAQWRAADGARSTILEVTVQAPLERVRVDPRGRITQSALRPDEPPSTGDADPARWQVIVTRMTAAGDPATGELTADLDLLLRPREALQDRLIVGASLRPSRVGGRGAWVHGLGGFLDGARQPVGVSLGLGADYLRAGFGGSTTEAGWAVGPSAAIFWDDRPSSAAPEEGRALSFGLSGAFGPGATGEVALWGGAGLAGTWLVPLFRRHVLALDGGAAAVLGEAPVQERIGPGLRGFSAADALGHRRLRGTVEWRHPLGPGLDVDVGLLRLRRLSGALFVDAALLDGLEHPPTAPATAALVGAGWGLRLHYDAFGVRPMLFSVDLGRPVYAPAGIFAAGPLTLGLHAGQAF